MMFTYEEINLMCIYDTSSRKGLISELTKMRKYLDPDEAEILELTDSAIRKLEKISDVEFECLELFADFVEDE
jgi:hypothetical protein